MYIWWIFMLPQNDEFAVFLNYIDYVFVKQLLE